MTANKVSDMESTLQHWVQYLPTQGSIKDFVHHNTLHAFQHMRFHDGIEAASRLFGSRKYLPEAHYANLLATKEISTQDLRFVIGLLDASVSPENFEQTFTQHYCDNNSTASETLRSKWNKVCRYDVINDIHSCMIKLTASYFDQGISLWPQPYCDLSFIDSIRELSRTSFFPLPPFHRDECRHLLQLQPLEAISACLSMLLQANDGHSQYLKEVLFALPGWAGLVYQNQLQPMASGDQRPANIFDWLAVFLIAEVGFIATHTGAPIPRLKSMQGTGKNRTNPETNQLQEVVHDAWEWSHYRPILKQISALSKVQDTRPSPDIQAIFCIDDREFSLRQHFEDADNRIETLGAPGFFGIDCYLQYEEDGDKVKHCPVPVSPQAVVREIPTSPVRLSWLDWLTHDHKHRKSLLRGWIFVNLLGLPSGLRLLLGTLSPHLAERRRLKQGNTLPKLLVFDHEFPKAERRTGLGYSIEAAATRVQNILTAIGKTAGFSKFIAVVGHGASSVNNPYFAAYDCGACSGRPGSANARAFCKIANHADVRRSLKNRGIDIGDDIIFVPFLHDTTADTIEILEPPHLFEETHRTLLNQFERASHTALGQNAQQRCGRFANAPPSMLANQARKHVQLRSVAWFEPRPEYNHATNIACVIGSRRLTSNLQSHRNIFLQSYYFRRDPTGDLLQNVLSAAIPVCGGINLEYMFSRVDSEVYGAGSKLPQNIVGLFGVMTGLESDLRTGLPTQMTDIHDPLRLLCVIEQNTAVVKNIIETSPAIADWIVNEWVRVVVFDSHAHRFYLFSKNRFIEIMIGDEGMP